MLFRSDRSGMKEGELPTWYKGRAGHSCVCSEEGNVPPPTAGPLVPDLEQMKRKATDELDRDRTWVIFSNPLTITCLSIVQKQMHYLLMLALYLCEA